jgi:hypothetical protein
MAYPFAFGTEAGEPYQLTRIRRLSLSAHTPLSGIAPGSAPFVTIIPHEFLLYGLCHTPSVYKAELGQNCSGGSQAEVVNQILPKNPHSHGVQQKRPPPCKANKASLWVQLQDFLVM